jgi:secreted PhoX family phosphatase
MSRREFLGIAGAGAVLGFGALDGLINRKALAQQGSLLQAGRGDGGYGPLYPLTRTDPKTGFSQTLRLPEGFDFQIFGLSGTRMNDGSLTPLAFDGMAAFPGPRGTVRLVRNHEDRNTPQTVTPSGSAKNRYDELGGGGTSTLQVRITDDGDRVLERAFMSLSGTIVNCAGGRTSWGSWLTCEETTAGPAAGWTRKHGYIFEVPAASNKAAAPVPLPAMGRFVHEAAAIDPRTGIVYETEDRDPEAGFYRFVPNVPGQLAAGGRLQMLKVVGIQNYDTRTGQTPGDRLPVEWVDIDVADPENAETDPLAVYKQGIAKGGAKFTRIEGCWWGTREVYFCCTNGGDAREGQVWEYRPGRGTSGGELTLVYESPSADVLSFPDNITVTPGGALLLCEDTGSRNDFYLQGLTRDGRIFPFCGTETGSEWAGATFSPDGETLFVNLFGASEGSVSNPSDPGRTVAIWGPWEKGAL